MSLLEVRVNIVNENVSGINYRWEVRSQGCVHFLASFYVTWILFLSLIQLHYKKNILVLKHEYIQKFNISDINVELVRV